jgi:hypothetical protein
VITISVNIEISRHSAFNRAQAVQLARRFGKYIGELRFVAHVRGQGTLHERQDRPRRKRSVRMFDNHGPLRRGRLLRQSLLTFLSELLDDSPIE